MYVDGEKIDLTREEFEEFKKLYDQSNKNATYCFEYKGKEFYGARGKYVIELFSQLYDPKLKKLNYLDEKKKLKALYSKVFAFYWGREVLLPAGRKVVNIDAHFFEAYSDHLKDCRIIIKKDYKGMDDSETSIMKEFIDTNDPTNGDNYGASLRCFVMSQYLIDNGYAVPLLILEGKNVLQAKLAVTKEECENILKAQS